MEIRSFRQRNLLASSKIIYEDFPGTARIALINLIIELENKRYFESLMDVSLELCRTARIEFIEREENLYLSDIKDNLKTIEWYYVFAFCEQLHKKLFSPIFEYDMNNNYIGEEVSLNEIQKFFTDEMNLILSEENIGYEFKDGIFNRIGRAHTQKNVIKTGSILTDEKLTRTRIHYTKALSFFAQMPEPDNENCIKEAICALESAAEILSGEKLTKDFCKELRKLEGNDEGKIPPPIIQSIIKIYGYRNNGQSISHGNTQGFKVTTLEAELVLNLTAGFITYLYDFFVDDKEIPF